jgi:hypothetical protein
MIYHHCLVISLRRRKNEDHERLCLDLVKVKRKRMDIVIVVVVSSILLLIIGNEQLTDRQKNLWEQQSLTN